MSTDENKNQEQLPALIEKLTEKLDKPIQETSEGMVHLKWRTFIGLLIMLIGSTNTATIFYQQQKHNTEQIHYERERAERINKRILQEAKDHYMIEELRRQLKECEEDQK